MTISTTANQDSFSILGWQATSTSIEFNQGQLENAADEAGDHTPLVFGEIRAVNFAYA